jgi:acyl-CoA thioesterase-2
MPAVPPFEECEPMPVPEEFAALAFGRIERRPAYGFEPEAGEAGTVDPNPGHRAVWARVSTAETEMPAALAWVADCVAMGIGQAIGGLSRATSLDNTIRYASPAASEWVLVDARATASVEGYAYGVVHLFTPDGRLLATASQTCLVRANEADDPWEGRRGRR